MKVMTLNVNGFKGGTEEAVPDKICIGFMTEIKHLLDKVVKNTDDIIILQEIPYMVKESRRWTWFENPLYKTFEEMFSNDYKIIRPEHLINAWHCTVALCKKESLWNRFLKDGLKYDSNYSYGNKVIELKYGDEDMTLLGVHISPKDDMWNLIIQGLKNVKYTYIVGDFNAYEKRGEMADKPVQIRACGYNYLIPNSVITCYKYHSSIDNIYMRSDFVLNENISVKVEKTKLTDHALCIFEFESNTLTR